MAYRAPKTITSHPGVLECDDAVAGGCEPGEYAHDVLLKKGWVFTNGRMAGARTGHFQSVERFRMAAPKRREETEWKDVPER